MDWTMKINSEKLYEIIHLGGYITLRWTKGTADRWSTLSFWNARYKNFKIKVSEGTTGFSRDVEYYWFSVNNEKLDVRQNSLWFEGKYESLEKAQDEAILWVDKFLTKDKKS